MSNTAIVGGIDSGPASPIRIMTVPSSHIGAVGGMTAISTRPTVIEANPAVIGARAPNRSTMRALNGVSTSPPAIIGRKVRPVSRGDSPRSCCRYKLITNGRPKYPTTKANPTALAIATSRERNSSRGTMGYRTRA